MAQIELYYDGYCPESLLQGNLVEMRLNDDDFWESEATGLQIAICPPYAIILCWRGKGKFRTSAEKASDIITGLIMVMGKHEHGHELEPDMGKVIENNGSLTLSLKQISMQNSELFSHEFPIIHEEFYESFKNWTKEMKLNNSPTEGVYTLKANKPIHRLLNIDESGILYIGKGIILSSSTRIGKLINALNQTEKRHDAGVRYNMDDFKNKFPLAELKLKVELINNSLELEKRKLKEYFDKFGELPPLNRIF